MSDVEHPDLTDSREPFDYDALDHNVAGQAREGAKKIRAANKDSTFLIGRELKAVKALLKNGQWLLWVENAAGITARNAQQKMSVVEHFDDDAKYETISHLPASLQYKLSAKSTPASVRARVINGELQVADRNSVLHAIAVEKVRARSPARKAAAKETPKIKKQILAAITQEIVIAAEGLSARDVGGRAVRELIDMAKAEQASA